jgi:rhodanese-related sulfurtransferase
MGFFSQVFGGDFKKHLEEAQATKGSFIIDVREPNEYANGHIQGALNIPLGNIESIKGQIPALDAPIFVYCASGARSNKAANWLKQAGYTKVENMGGLMSYAGPLVH